MFASNTKSSSVPHKSISHNALTMTIDDLMYGAPVQHCWADGCGRKNVHLGLQLGFKEPASRRKKNIPSGKIDQSSKSINRLNESNRLDMG